MSGLNNYQAVRIVQALISIITALIIAVWSYILFGKKCFFVTLLITSIYPPFYLFYFGCSSILSETLYIFLLTLSLFIFYKGIQSQRMWLFVTAGFLWGLSSLTRPASLPIFPVMIFILWLERPRVGKFFGKSALFIIGLMLAITPWLFRNYLVFKKFPVFTTLFGGAFHSAYHPGPEDGDGAKFYRDFLYPEEIKLKSNGMDEPERSSYFMSKGLKFIREEPRLALNRFFWRVFLYMDPFHVECRNRIKKWKIINLPYLLVLGGALLSWFLRRDRRDTINIISLWVLFAAFLIFQTVFTMTMHRYRLPTESILIILCSFSVCSYKSLMQRLEKLPPKRLKTRSSRRWIIFL
jgi:4-amino-4-deoxy-L-arabinose transferase-like glycosyltransferase